MTTLEMSENEIKEMVITRIITEYGYPETDIEKEIPANIGNARLTADVIVYANQEPHILIELKPPKYNILRGKQQLEKLCQAIRPNYCLISNGVDNAYYKVQKEGFSTVLIEIPDVPRYQEQLENLSQLKKEDLTPLSTKRYLTMMWRHFDVLRGEAYPIFDSFRYLLLLYAAKYYDETSGKYNFNVEENNEHTQNKILGIVNELLYSNKELDDVRIPFSPEIIQYITLDMQKVSLSSSTSEFREVFPQLIQRFGSHIEEYTTPEIISNLINQLLSPTLGASFLDPACGIGGFLVKAAEYGADVRGIELSRETRHLANLILMLSGYEGVIRWGNSLNILPQEIEKYDYVAVSPPFGQKITEPMHDLELYNYSANTTSEELFVEASIKYLKTKGLGAILLPYGFLFHSKYSHARKYLLNNSLVKAIIKINPGTYTKWFNIISALIIFQKDKTGTSPKDKIFFANTSKDNYQIIIEQYNNYLKGNIIKNTESIFASNIESENNLDIDYIRGTKYLSSFDSSDYIDLRRLTDIISGTSQKRIGEKDENGEYYYIRAADFGEGTIETSNAIRISVDDPDSKYIAKPGDLMLSRAGTVGKVAIVSKENLIAGSNVLLIRAKDERISPEYILGFFLSSFGQQQLDMYSRGTTISHINSSNLGKLRIPLLDAVSQREIVSLLDDMVSLKKKEENIIKQIEDERSQLFNRLDSKFGGDQ